MHSLCIMCLVSVSSFQHYYVSWPHVHIEGCKRITWPACLLNWQIISKLQAKNTILNKQQPKKRRHLYLFCLWTDKSLTIQGCFQICNMPKRCLDGQRCNFSAVWSLKVHAQAWKNANFLKKFFKLSMHSFIFAGKCSDSLARLQLGKHHFWYFLACLDNVQTTNFAFDNKTKKEFGIQKTEE